MEKLADQLSDALNKITEISAKYAPDAARLALEVARLGALRSLIIGAIALLIAIAGVIMMKKTWMIPQRAWDDTPLPFLCMTCGGVALVSGTIGALVHLSDVYAWAGLSRPEIWLAAKLLKL